jgi:putative nucleotidyltransferase with HDIG domain
MTSRRADSGAGLFGRNAAPGFVTALILGGCVVGVIAGRPDRVDALSGILGVAAVGAGVLGVGERGGRLGVTAAFIVNVLAAAFLGPASAAGTALIVELTATVVSKTRWRTMVLNNLGPAVAGGVAPALVIQSLTSKPADQAGFYFTVALAGAVSLVLSFLLVALLRRLVSPEAEQFQLRMLLEFLPSGGLSILVVAAGISIELRVGNGGIAFALAAVFAFSYMAHLLEQSRNRAKQYASLSWGVLAGLMRSLDIRDQRAARHSAAVARFARDIAKEVGMTPEEQELAHTAGLLHDIGRFALSDRVAERGRTLTEEDWTAIQRHPELGADMLRDLGMYGPVAEIVLTHHERIDGRGYPHGLGSDEIPAIAKIIAVAEVYDTLTASDTYRTQMSSFEALRELRRVAGTQLDEHYVEVLAGLLAGVGVEYRHADMADFDTELNMERRIREASAGA